MCHFYVMWQVGCQLIIFSSIFVAGNFTVKNKKQDAETLGAARCDRRHCGHINLLATIGQVKVIYEPHLKTTTVDKRATE